MDDSARAGITPIVMPKWGLSMKEGTVMSWLVEEGAEISVGAPILEVETDKIANAVEAPDPGTLRRKVAQAGETLPVKALLGVMAGAGVSDADIDAYVAAYVTPAESEGEDAEAEPAYQFAEVDGLRIRYARKGAGSGVPVLFIHGFGGDLDNWLFNLDAASEKSPVIALDLPGHGQSTVRLPGHQHRGAGRFRRTLHGRAGGRAGASRGPLDGRGDRRADGAGSSAACRVDRADRSGRPRAGDQSPATPKASWRRRRGAS